VDPASASASAPSTISPCWPRSAKLAEPSIPVLVGVSRKSLIGIITGRPPEGRLAGSVAFAALAVMRGAAIIRAHDVAETVDAVKVASALRRATPGGD